MNQIPSLILPREVKSSLLWFPRQLPSFSLVSVENTPAQQPSLIFPYPLFLLCQNLSKNRGKKGGKFTKYLLIYCTFVYRSVLEQRETGYKWSKPEVKLAQLTQGLKYTFKYSFTYYLFIRSFIHSLINSFVHSFIHSKASRSLATEFCNPIPS